MKCKDCKWGEYEGIGKRRCRRYPPVGEDGRFPVVDRDDYCGEFEKPQPSLAELREEDVEETEKQKLNRKTT